MVSFDRHGGPEYLLADQGVDLALYATSYQVGWDEEKGKHYRIYIPLTPDIGTFRVR